ncbi:MAG: hypothetical protein QOC68_4697, partial [Solirubrobacteraceae bacterium]|nr:hypothetical protein [Solirubrobacteraceae bacterium]
MEDRAIRCVEGRAVTRAVQLRAGGGHRAALVRA